MPTYVWTRLYIIIILKTFCTYLLNSKAWSIFMNCDRHAPMHHRKFSKLFLRPALRNIYRHDSRLGIQHHFSLLTNRILWFYYNIMIRYDNCYNIDKFEIRTMSQNSTIIIPYGRIIEYVVRFKIGPSHYYPNCISLYHRPHYVPKLYYYNPVTRDIFRLFSSDSHPGIICAIRVIYLLLKLYNNKNIKK